MAGGDLRLLREPLAVVWPGLPRAPSDSGPPSQSMACGLSARWAADLRRTRCGRSGTSAAGVDRPVSNVVTTFEDTWKPSVSLTGGSLRRGGWHAADARPVLDRERQHRHQELQCAARRRASSEPTSARVTFTRRPRARTAAIASRSIPRRSPSAMASTPSRRGLRRRRQCHEPSNSRSMSTTTRPRSR